MSNYYEKYLKYKKKYIYLKNKLRNNQLINNNSTDISTNYNYLENKLSEKVGGWFFNSTKQKIIATDIILFYNNEIEADTGNFVSPSLMFKKIKDAYKEYVNLNDVNLNKPLNIANPNASFTNTEIISSLQNIQKDFNISNMLNIFKYNIGDTKIKHVFKLNLPPLGNSHRFQKMVKSFNKIVEQFKNDLTYTIDDNNIKIIKPINCYNIFYQLKRMIKFLNDKNQQNQNLSKDINIFFQLMKFYQDGGITSVDMNSLSKYFNYLRIPDGVVDNNQITLTIPNLNKNITIDINKGGYETDVGKIIKILANYEKNSQFEIDDISNKLIIDGDIKFKPINDAIQLRIYKDFQSKSVIEVINIFDNIEKFIDDNPNGET